MLQRKLEKLPTVNTQRNNSETAPGADEPSGRVRFDDRGNAVWETWRGRRLEHPALAIMDDDLPSPSGAAKVNAKAGRLGYNPYESGLVRKKTAERPRKKDLRTLSHWIQMQKIRGEKD